MREVEKTYWMPPPPFQQAIWGRDGTVKILGTIPGLVKICKDNYRKGAALPPLDGLIN
jgi:hypothetical protein